MGDAASLSASAAEFDTFYPDFLTTKTEEMSINLINNNLYVIGAMVARLHST